MRFGHLRTGDAFYFTALARKLDGRQWRWVKVARNRARLQGGGPELVVTLRRPIYPSEVR